MSSPLKTPQIQRSDHARFPRGLKESAIPLAWLILCFLLPTLDSKKPRGPKYEDKEDDQQPDRPLDDPSIGDVNGKGHFTHP